MTTPLTTNAAMRAAPKASASIHAALQRPEGFCAQVWQRNLALYQSTLALPFNQELAAGTLSRGAFAHYVIQDAHYLLAYGRALAVCAAKAFDAQGVLQFAAAAQVAIEVERQLHNGFMQQLGITRDAFENTPLSAACHHYSANLLATAWSESYPVVLASLLPCFWIYAEVGRDIHAASVPGNPYQAWVDTYASEDFHNAVLAVIDTVDRAAAQSDAHTIAKMHAAYTDSARLEWMFWDSAYAQRQWAGLEKL